MRLMRLKKYQRPDSVPKFWIEDSNPKKDLVVLHFTAGTTAESAIRTFEESRKQRGFPLGTAYVIAPDGLIHELFDDKWYSYHLGIRGIHSQFNAHDKRSVGVEIVNAGPLKKIDDYLCYWPNGFTEKYCPMSDVAKYVPVKSGYRGIQYFARFTDEQIAIVAQATAALCDKFNIPKVIPPADKRYECDLDYFSKYKGVASHVNFRPDKWDLAPAQSWNIWASLIRDYDFEVAQ